jgi:hypothetical protein
VDAGHVQVGDGLLLRSGRVAEVVRVATRMAGLTVYNLHVEGTHTYTVGRAGVLVHNKMLNRPPARRGAIGPTDAPQRFEQINKHKPGGFGSIAILSDADAAKAINLAVEIKPGMRAIRLSNGDVAIFRSTSKKPGTVGSDLWHGGWKANAEELKEIGKIPLPTFP